MKRFVIILLCMPLITIAQKSNGIKFEHSLTWEQVKEKAKSEKKFIFVDCYATWCGPCKLMDKEIFTIDSVGEYFNTHFVSIRIQMDKTNEDNDTVRSWYQEAEKFQKEYAINAYPTYLFFSSDGEIVHRSLGFLQAPAFLQASRDALDPLKQYSALLKIFYENQDDRELLKKLAIKAQKMGYDSMATKFSEKYLDKLYSTELIRKENMDFLRQFNKSPKALRLATEYKQNFLDKLDYTTLFKKENFDFVFSFPQLISSSDGFFYYFFRFPEKTDSLIESPLSIEWVKYIINNEEINSKLWVSGKPKTTKPDWAQIERAINLKYGIKYSKILLTDAQIRFYRHIEDWARYVKLIEVKIKSHPPKEGGVALSSYGDAFALNEWAWDIFQHCNSKRLLKRALKWTELAFKLDKGIVAKNADNDTKANLLYKLGRKEKAIILEQSVLIADLEYKEKRGLERKPLSKNEFYITLNKMKRAVPTWVVKDTTRDLSVHK